MNDLGLCLQAYFGRKFHKLGMKSGSFLTAKNRN